MSHEAKMFPLVRGVICGDEIIIEKCSICGAAHIHGHDNDEKVGTYTHRIAHCQDKRGYWLYIISIECIVRMSDRNKRLKNFGKPKKVSHEPGLISSEVMI